VVGRGRWPEPGVGHFQGLEDPLRDEFVKGYPTHARHDLSQHKEIDIAVDEPFARQRDGTLVHRSGDCHVMSLELLFQRKIRTQARQMGHEMLDRDPALVVARETWNVAIDRVAESQSALVDEHHDGGCCRNDLRERREVEDRVTRHGFLGRTHNAPAKRTVIYSLAAVPDQNYSTRKGACLNGFLDEVIDPVENGRLDVDINRRTLKCKGTAGRGRD
jgi:hypothetical protein